MGARGEDLKDARGHEHEKGERVEDRKFTSRVDARAGEEEEEDPGEAEGEERFNAFPR